MGILLQREGGHTAGSVPASDVSQLQLLQGGCLCPLPPAPTLWPGTSPLAAWISDSPCVNGGRGAGGGGEEGELNKKGKYFLLGVHANYLLSEHCVEKDSAAVP